MGRLHVQLLPDPTRPWLKTPQPWCREAEVSLSHAHVIYRDSANSPRAENITMGDVTGQSALGTSVVPLAAAAAWVVAAARWAMALTLVGATTALVARVPSHGQTFQTMRRFVGISAFFYGSASILVLCSLAHGAACCLSHLRNLVFDLVVISTDGDAAVWPSHIALLPGPGAALQFSAALVLLATALSLLTMRTVSSTTAVAIPDSAPGFNGPATLYCGALFCFPAGGAVLCWSACRRSGHQRCTQWQRTSQITEAAS